METLIIRRQHPQSLTLHLNARCMRKHAQVLEETCFNLVQVLRCVLVGHVGGADVQLEVRAVVLKVIIVGQLVSNLHSKSNGRLVGPGTGHVADGVSSTTHKQQRQIELLHELHAFAVTCIEDSQE